MTKRDRIGLNDREEEFIGRMALIDWAVIIWTISTQVRKLANGKDNSCGDGHQPTE